MSKSCPVHGEHKFITRKYTAPTGYRKQWAILVDSCMCGAVNPIHPDELTYQQSNWVERWNRRIERDEA